MRYGCIAFAGRPNAGKSTLLNAILETKLAIVSPRPQTTRHPVVGVYTEGDVQLCFIDPPGLLQPEYALQEAMLAEAIGALADADGIVALQAADDAASMSLQTLLPDVAIRTPVLHIRTKADLVPAGDRRAASEVTLWASGRTGEGVDAVVEWCRARARPGVFRYDRDTISTQPVRFFVSEFVREAAFDALEQELPYAVAVEIDEFREDSDPVYIRADLFVERESQKGMVIGRGGRTVKAIGSQARRAAEELLGQRIFLDLRVRVLPKWRTSPHHLRRMGFPVRELESR